MTLLHLRLTVSPDYYDHVPRPFQIIGYDGAGVVVEVGPDCKSGFKPGDEIFFLDPPTLQGTAAEYTIFDERTAALKPKTLDFVESASLPLTYGTAYEMCERLEIPKGEKVGMLIINGAGGVGSIATQFARNVLELPVVIATAGRPETIDWCKKMGATHVVNHREDLRSQIKDLKLDVPIKYILINSTTSMYLDAAADICAPLGKISTIVQDRNVNFYGTQFLSKSLTFNWCWLGTRLYHDYDRDAQTKWMADLSRQVDEGKIKCTLTKRLRLTADNLKEAHTLLEDKGMIGKLGLGVDEKGEGEVFA